jgi:succinate dehydrogenase / fumarate reductase iron-sulfur subunit
VNGREALGCVTPVPDAGDLVTVEPLANIPVLADLVVDMRDFYARLPGETHALVRESESPPGAEAPRGIDAFARFEDCLECGLCLSACPIAATSRAYVGPAALTAAQRLLEEPRGADERTVLDWAGQPGGAWNCHAAYECTAACPSNAGPAERIMTLRGRLLRPGERR